MTGDIHLDSASRWADQLLPGEVLDSEHPHDAEHWVAVYQEMIAFLLLVQFDVSQALERCRRRLQHWMSRRDGRPAAAAEKESTL